MESPEKKCAHCSIPCEMKCSKCVKVWYCSVEHQKLHRKIHKDNCFPAIELTNDRQGHYFASTRKILAGEMIFAEGPLIVSPFATNELRFSVCLGCSKVLPEIFGDGQHICQKCSWPLCKPDCEKISCHSENECKMFQGQIIKPTDFPQIGIATAVGDIYDCIMTIRILLLKESDPERYGKILQLESHVELLNRSCTDFAQTFIHDFCKMSPTTYSFDIINKVLGVVLLNSIQLGCYNVPGKTGNSYIYEKGSKLCHSCIPNTKNAVKRSTTTTIRQVFALTDIEKDQMLTVSYGLEQNFLIGGIVERRHDLNDKRRFWCSCPRCSDPTELGTYFSAIKCKGRNCAGFYLPLNSLSTDGHDSIWKCTSEKCKNREKYSKLSKTFAAIPDEIMQCVGIESRLKIIQKHGNVTVHENHFSLMKLRHDFLPELLLELDFVNKADPKYVHICTKLIEFAEKCLEIAHKLAPGLSYQKGMILFYLAQARHKSILARGLDPKAAIQAIEESKPIREEAKRILEVCPGGSIGHEFYETLVTQDEKFSKGFGLPELVMREMKMCKL